MQSIGSCQLASCQCSGVCSCRAYIECAAKCSGLCIRSAYPAIYVTGILARFGLSLHPHNIGRPNAAKHLDEALRYILGHDGVWNTTADDIAEYYIANCYDQVSSWIAERNAQP